MLQPLFNSIPLDTLTFVRDLLFWLPIPFILAFCFFGYVYLMKKPKAAIPIANWGNNHFYKIASSFCLTFIMFGYYNYSYYNYLATLYSGAIAVTQVSAKGSLGTDVILNSPNYQPNSSEREALTTYIQILRERGLLSDTEPTVKKLYELSIALFNESDDFHN